MWSLTFRLLTIWDYALDYDFVSHFRNFISRQFQYVEARKHIIVLKRNAMPRKLIIYNTLSADATQAQDALFRKFQDNDDRVTLLGCTPASLIIILDKILLLESIDKVYDRIVVIGCSPTLRCCRLLDGSNGSKRIDRSDGSDGSDESNNTNDERRVADEHKFVTIYDLCCDKGGVDDLAEKYMRIDHKNCDKNQLLQDCVSMSENNKQENTIG
jgi:hypothetical protein